MPWCNMCILFRNFSILSSFSTMESSTDNLSLNDQNGLSVLHVTFVLSGHPMNIYSLRADITESLLDSSCFSVLICMNWILTSKFTGLQFSLVALTNHLQQTSASQCSMS